MPDTYHSKCCVSWHIPAQEQITFCFSLSESGTLCSILNAGFNSQSRLESGLGKRTVEEAVKEASIDRVRPKLMTAATAILGLMPLLVLRLHGTEIESAWQL
jgi:Cu/Ag efflux pump CusA